MIIRDLLIRLGVRSQGFRNAERGVNRLRGSARSLAGTFARGLGIAGGLAAINSQVRAGIRLASSAEETQDLLKDVIGDSREAVNEFARTFGNQVGRSTLELQRFSAEIAAVGNNIFDTEQETAKYSTRLTALAVDLASAFNRKPEEALIALRAALVGEGEPIRRFGVDIRDAALNQFALAEGIGKTTKQMTQQEKSLLVISKLFKDTAKFQGNATRTAGSFANQNLRLQSNIKELQQALGERLLPALTKFIQFINFFLEDGRALDEALQTIRFGFESLALVIAAIKLGQFAFFINGLIVAFPALGTAIGLAIGPLAAVAGAVTLLIFIIKDLKAGFEGGESVAFKFGDTLSNLADNFANLKFESVFFDKLLNAVQLVLQPLLFLKDTLFSVVSLLAGGKFSDVIGALKESGLQNVVNPFKNLFGIGEDTRIPQRPGAASSNTTQTTNANSQTNNVNFVINDASNPELVKQQVMEGFNSVLRDAQVATTPNFRVVP